MNKKIFLHPLAITLYVVIFLGLLSWGGYALFNAGAKSALENELLTVNQRLQNTSVRTSSEEHLKLLARRRTLEQLLKKY